MEADEKQRLTELLESLDDMTVSDMLFAVEGAKKVAQIFSTLAEVSETRLENVAYLADHKMAHGMTGVITKHSVSYNKEQIKRDAAYDLGLYMMKQWAEIALNIHKVRGDLTSEPIKTFAEALNKLSEKERSGKGIAKAFFAMIDKIAEDNEMPPEPEPKKKKPGPFGRKGPKPL